LRSWRHGLVGLATGITVALASFGLFFPFYQGFYSVVQGVNRADSGSPLSEFLTVWGIFFGIVTLALTGSALRVHRSTLNQRDGLALSLTVLLPGMALTAVAFVVAGVSSAGQTLIALLLAAAVAGAAGIASCPSSQPRILSLPLVGIAIIAGAVAPWRPSASVALALVVAGTAHAIRFRRQPSRLLPWAFAAIGSMTIAATEFVYVADDLQHSNWERMNTVFKFSLPAWILLGVASAALLARLWKATGQRVGPFSQASLGITVGTRAGTERIQRQQNAPARRHATVLAGCASLLLMTGLLYPLLGTPARLSWQMPSSPTGLSLNGYAWMNGGQIQNGTGQVIDFTGDLAAIRWLDANARGNAVILEASIGPYRGNGSRISSATGLPTVLGWDRHQRQQRYQAGIDQRMSDVRLIYNETDTSVKLEKLRRYDVRYVIVGDVERYWNTVDDPAPYASSAGLNAFDELVGHGLSVAFESGDTRVYEVHDFDRLPPAANAEQAP
jgi:uncharacterized membrane protein